MQKQTYKLRKSKAVKNLVNIAMVGGAMVALSTGSLVSADEVTSTSVATNTTETATSSTDATVDNVNAELSNAVTEAESAGVTVTKDTTVTYTEKAEAIEDANAQITAIAEATETVRTQTEARDKVLAENKVIEEQNAQIEAENKVAQANYDEAMKVYEVEKAKYEEAVKAREEALKNPTYETTSDAFPKTELDEFVTGSDLSKISYISVADENVSKLDASSLDKLTFETLDSFYQKLFDGKVVTYNGTDSGSKQYTKWYNDVKAGKTGYYNVKVGDTFTFSNVFLSADTGQYVGLKYNVAAITGFDGESLSTAMLEVRDGLNLTQMGDSYKVDYDVTLIDSEGNPVTVSKAILGFGDVDTKQAISVTSSSLQEKYLAGSIVHVTKDGDTMTAKSDDIATALSSETKGQVWFMLDNVSSFSYSFANGRVWGNPKTAYGWHQIGAIPFGIVIPNVPEAPTKPELLLGEFLPLADVPDVDEVAISYHLVEVLVPKVEEKKAEKPVVAEPPKSQPKAEAPALPNTGQASSLGLTVLGMVALFGSLFGLRKRNEK